MPQFSPGDQVELTSYARVFYSHLAKMFCGVPATVVSTDSMGCVRILYVDGEEDCWHESHFQLAGPPNNVRAMSNKVLREYQNAQL